MVQNFSKEKNFLVSPIYKFLLVCKIKQLTYSIVKITSCISFSMCDSFWSIIQWSIQRNELVHRWLHPPKGHWLRTDNNQDTTKKISSSFSNGAHSPSHKNMRKTVRLRIRYLHFRHSISIGQNSQTSCNLVTF